MAKNGILDRNDMVKVITAGGSVLHDGLLINRVEHLPATATFAKTPEERASASKAIDEQIAELERQQAMLEERADILSDLGNATLLQLVDVATEHGIENAENFESKAALIAAIREKIGDTPATVPGPAVTQSDKGGTPPQVPNQQSKAADDPAKPTNAAATALGKMTVEQLKTVAGQAGVADVDSMNDKDLLIAAITEQTQLNIAKANASGS